MADEKKKPGITDARLALWIVGGAFGIYLVVSGIMGALNS